MSSSRLPGKVLLPLGRRLVLDHVIDRSSEFSTQVIVCTSTDPEDDPIADHCTARAVVCSRGPLEDVFSRSRESLLDSRATKTVWFARATADCPLISPRLARRLIDAASTGSDLDYVAAPAGQLPRGLSIELVRRSTFLALDSTALDGPEREHVTLRLYEREGEFRCKFVAPPPELCHPQFRLTLDYPEDYELLQRLFEDDDALTAEQAVGRLLAEPQLAEINRGCLQKDPRAGF